MPAIDYSISVRAARERIIATLAELLPAELAALELANPGFPLPPPEVYIRSRQSFEKAFGELNIDEVACWVVKDGAANPETWETADVGGKMAVDQTQLFRVTVIVKFPGSVPANAIVPEGGRPYTEEEWLEERAELYKGAVIDVLSANAADTVNVHELYPRSNDATAITTSVIGPHSQASQIVEVKQETLVNIKVNPAL